jgi:two-component system cell cycle sensor histidine kinase/response regulator CckA
MNARISQAGRWQGRRLVSAPSAGVRYGVAVFAALAALVVRIALDPVLGAHSPYLPSTLAVMVAAWFGGRGPGFAATAFSTLGIQFFLIEPRFSFAIAHREAVAGLALFVVVASLISVLVGNLRASQLAIARAEEALWRKAQLVDLSHDAIITADAGGRITGWNAGAEEMYGWKEAEALGKSMHDLLCTGGVPTGDIDEILHRAGRWDGELNHTAKGGRRLVVESCQKLVRDEANQPVGILEIDRDLTGRKQAEEQLAAEYRKNTAILESISDGFNTFDREWRYTYVNPPAARMVGKTPEELLGKVIWELWPQASESPFGVAYRRAVEENVQVQVEAFYPEPLNRWFEVRCYPSPEGLSLFFTDTTERRRTEERLRQTQKLESIGLLAGGVAHDFNNILTVIMGSASAALTESPSCEHCKAILSAAERAAYLTRQLLAYAGKGHTVAKLIDLTDLVSGSTELLAASVPKRVSLSYSLSKDLPCLEADPSQIEQILMNLVINAGEAIPLRSDGLIEIATSSFEVTPEMARQHSQTYDVAAGGYICLEVRDNGEGMDESTAAHIFDPFFTTKFTGRGLGLAALQGIVRTAKGFVEVRSRPGQGTTFRVFLPASEKERPQELAKNTPRQHVRGASTILVVEDEEMVRRLACLTLRRYGYEVQEAHDGKDALRVLAESASLPSLVLLDLAMPVMGGDELAPILGAKYPGLKIVMSSGYPEDEARKVSPNGSIASFLQKPYTPAALAEKIAQVLERT